MVLNTNNETAYEMRKDGKENEIVTAKSI